MFEDSLNYIDDILDMTEEEIEQAYLDWENSINYQVEDLGISL